MVVWFMVYGSWVRGEKYIAFFGSSFKVVEVSGSTITLYDRNQGNQVVISTYSGSVRLSTSDQMTSYSARDYLRTTFYE